MLGLALLLILILGAAGYGVWYLISWAAALDTTMLRPYSLPFRTFSLKHPKSNVQLVL